MIYFQVLLSTRHSGQGGRPALGLPVRRRAQDRRDRRGRLHRRVARSVCPSIRLLTAECLLLTAPVVLTEALVEHWQRRRRRHTLQVQRVQPSQIRTGEVTQRMTTPRSNDEVHSYKKPLRRKAFTACRV